MFGVLIIELKKSLMSVQTDLNQVVTNPISTLKKSYQKNTVIINEEVICGLQGFWSLMKKSGELGAWADPDGASDILLQLSLVKNTVALNRLG